MKLSFTGDMLDITGASLVEVTLINKPTGAVLWINVDGRCRLRICRINGTVALDTPEPDETSHHKDHSHERPN